MELYGTEKIWCYLHDDRRLVKENMFVTDTYLYTSKLIDMLTVNPECLDALKYKMYLERIHDFPLFVRLRNGYGKTELRIVKMMEINGLGDILKNYFQELIDTDDLNYLKNNL